jgi:hypothetical protein
MLVSLKKQKNAKSGCRTAGNQAGRQIVPSVIGANDISRTYAKTSGTSCPITSPARIRADRKLKKHGVRAGNPELSAFGHALSTAEPRRQGRFRPIFP